MGERLRRKGVSLVSNARGAGFETQSLKLLAYSFYGCLQQCARPRNSNQEPCGHEHERSLELLVLRPNSSP